MRLKPNIFFDMDGVIAVYEKDAYIPESGKKPLYLDLDKHYFRTCKKNEHAASILQMLRSLNASDERMHEVKPFVNTLLKKSVSLDTPARTSVNVSNYIFSASIHVLSRIPQSCKEAIVITEDKKRWLDEHFTNKNMTRREKGICFNTSFKNKAETAEHILSRPLRPADILIDDYNPNLIEWERRGGTAIKYLNGQNDANSWEGLCVSSNETPAEIVSFIMMILIQNKIADVY